MLNSISLPYYQIHHKKIFPFVFYISLFFCLLLNGCSTSRRDGPPSYDVDISKIPDAIPKVEPLSKVGNKPYIVRGEKYYIMRSSKNYEERGIASWYGTKFHGHNASDGERYDMLAMTAAHKTLPLPTYVVVTNLKNGRKVIVKVTDRGPFKYNRLIDLSYVAAKKLGMLAHGTAPVDVKAIDPLYYDKNNHFKHPIFLAKNNQKQQIIIRHSIPNRVVHVIYIQVGAFHNKIYAEKLKKRLISVVNSPVNITKLAKLHQLYRVQIGPVPDAIRAAQINRRLRAMGIQSVV
ncbi:MAG: RlpA-like protein [Gammaproteobacteria bacterium]|jgi:rare lipoprotein A|nr:RlpA-like protein [Gammaproteobacteria bacterium]